MSRCGYVRGGERCCCACGGRGRWVGSLGAMEGRRHGRSRGGVGVAGGSRARAHVPICGRRLGRAGICMYSPVVYVSIYIYVSHVLRKSCDD